MVHLLGGDAVIRRFAAAGAARIIDYFEKEKDAMAKMMKPEVEAVRFGEVDVIATSGLRSGQDYAAFKSEYNEYDSEKSWGESHKWVTFAADGLDIPSEVDYYTMDASGTIYAWYDNGSWQTDNRPLSSYNLFPIGGGVSWNKDGQ